MLRTMAAVLLLSCTGAHAALYDDLDFGHAGYVDVDIGSAQYLYDSPELRVLPDRRIVAAAMLSEPAPQLPVMKLVQLLPDGSADPGFGNAGVATIAVGTDAVDFGRLSELIRLPDGRLLLRSWTVRIEQPPGGDPIYHQFSQLIRLQGNGAVDASFNGGLPWTTDDARYASARVLVHDDAVTLLALPQYCCFGNPMGFTARRLRADGTTDTAFGTGGLLTVPAGTSYPLAAMPVAGSGFQVLHYVPSVSRQPPRNF